MIEGLALLGLGSQELGIGDKRVSTDLLALKGTEHRFISRTKEGRSGADVSGKVGRFFTSLNGDLNWTVGTWDLEITRESVAWNRSDATARVILSKG